MTSETIDPRTPVLVGVGQWVDRTSAPGEGLSPMDMLATAARAALADSGASGDVAALIDAIAVVRLFQDSGFGAPFGKQNNLPWSLARRIGAVPRRYLYGPVGGNTPQMLANLFMAEIAAGAHEVVLLAGCEPIRTQSRAQKAGITLDWAEDAPTDAETPGKDGRFVSPHELAHGIALPVNVYPLFENALAAHYGREPVAHRRAIGELMARFTEVAATNPFAQIPVARTAEELITPAGDNRYIGYPYTKYLNANMFVDQAAALLLMSVAAADRLGVPAAKRVFLHGSADTVEKVLVTERVNYWSSPAIRVGGQAALAAADATISDIAHIDLYSCFPSAVEIAADELGIAHDDPRGLTLTGGLPYFGGPGNNYSMHAIAEVAARCRAAPGSRGLVFANGGYLTKHSFGIWSTAPRPFHRADPATYQQEIDAMASPPLVEKPEGPGTIETFTVIHDRGEPAFAIVIGRLADGGGRFLAQIHAGLEALVDAPAIGRPVTVSPGDPVNRARLA
ncbi:acetyl-CoA acetyltransferase [Thermaurantiacus sp.]